MNAPVDPLPDTQPQQTGSAPAQSGKSISLQDLGVIAGFIATVAGIWWFFASRIYAQLSPLWQGRIRALEMPFVVTLFWGLSCFFIVATIYGYRYLLSDKRDATLEALRERTASKQGAGSWYRHAVERALEVTDKFFGDAGKADQSWQPRAFGLLRADAPLWTAASYDRCLLIALIYPMLCIYAVWAFTGDAGDAGSALGLINGWGIAHAARVMIIVAIAISWIVFTHGEVFWNGWPKFIALLFCLAIAFVLAITFNFTLPAIVSLAVTSAIVEIYRPANTNYNGVFCLAFCVAIAGSIAFFEIENSLIGLIFFISAVILVNLQNLINKIIMNVIISLYIIFIIISIFTIDNYLWIFVFINIIIILAASEKVIDTLSSDKNNIYIMIYTTILFVFCLVAPLIVKYFSGPLTAGALLFFLPFLTLINAPFDWAALGVTRTLLRKGLEQGGITPLWWGFVDLIISLVTIALLGATVIILTQVFNAMTLLGGAKEVIFDPLEALRGIADQATHYNSEYYWLYLMLLTTQLPAILNLTAGFLAVMRTADIGTDWLARFVAPGAATTVPMRLWLAALQAAQVAIALTLGFIALGVIYYGILKGIEFTASTTMLDLFLSIAQANWPARWFGV